MSLNTIQLFLNLLLIGENMSETCEAKMGASVPDFELDTYDPETGDFGKVSLSDLKSQGKWTILFFYPADFTFV